MSSLSIANDVDLPFTYEVELGNGKRIRTEALLDLGYSIISVID